MTDLHVIVSPTATQVCWLTNRTLKVRQRPVLLSFGVINMHLVLLECLYRATYKIETKEVLSI